MKPQLNKQLFSFLVLSQLLIQTALFAQGVEGYYRFPNIHSNTIVFTAEGDIWTVPLTGGLAQRLTTHAEEETDAAISPDGTTIAFSASYEGPQEIYTMPISGGLPTRWTFESDASTMNCWTPDGKVVYDTRAYATLPDRQLVTIDPATKKKSRVPLAQASEASFDATGKTVYFVRPSYHGNVTKRYKGGTARQIWKYTEGHPEAVQLTLGYAGESHHPMWYNGRVYFITDRDGTMNIWSIDENGGGLTQHTTNKNFDVRDAGLHNGHIVYQWGADIWHYSIPDDTQTKIDIRIPTDLDQLRERWVDNPAQYISSVSPDKEGNKIVITARGRVFAVPLKSGRTVEFTDKKDVRYRDAVFSADGKNIYTLSDESGEFEFISMPANGIGAHKAITKDGTVLRYKGTPSPDGKWLAYDDLERHMFVLNLGTGVSKRISTSEEGIGMFSWSPDSKWIAFVQSADNTMDQIFVSNVDTGDTFPITTDRANSLWPAWSPDGKFIYFLSDRSFTTLVGSPWGARQPEPYFDASEKIYHIALQKGTRSPFRPEDELAVKTDKPEGKEGDKKEEAKPAVAVKIDKDGIAERIEEVPVSPGNYRGLEVTKKGLYLLSSETGVGAKTHLGVVKITNDDPRLVTMIEDINGFNLTGNGEKMLVVKQRNYYMVEAGTGKVTDLNDKKIDLSGWKFAITPKEDWEQIFTDAWRMERDYFYDKNMHGVNWDAMHGKYLPLVDRVTTREELSDLIGRFVGELSALHTSVRGGDTREDKLDVVVASLGAICSRDDNNGGYSIDYIYKADPDYPDEKSPLDDPYLDIKVGDIITSVNGKAALNALDIGELIRNQAGKQVRMSVKRGTAEKDVIVVPMANPYSLRYRDWEYSRRLEVDNATAKSVGYVHLQAMGSNDLEQWYREFYPVFDRQGLIIDVRHNRGGNIESFVLEKLLRKAWMYWKSRSGKPYWNMQYAFRGHIVILVDQNTASDGESFADGFKRLELGTAIGTRTWGGEIWLSGVNTLSDGGIARAPMMGVYGPEGKWLVEGHGFEPDIVVDNLPHATFEGEDAQLKVAIEFLQLKIKEDPRPVPPVPAYPDKSFENK
ncbi:S41 family peptidase [uncultured Imperialibacter sp.]|uniref:S41 family peptidase n=1 Tax=uncultured Imperialibacter sp. TaxID=1672639 RepID=UPI0030DB0B3E|tara:strand:+ start:16272 stop:19532 length:3261 start_codon:yes stop_codon:yes gene_type:complete